MIASINRDNVIWTDSVSIKCQHPLVNYDEEMSNLTKKIHNLQTIQHIHPKIDDKKLKEKDYVHHFMTQIVIKY
jgi:hypothetical protein